MLLAKNMKCLSSGSVIMPDKRQACLHYVGVDALPEDMVGPHDAIMASCGMVCQGQHFLINQHCKLY